jgi:hypothetical protein
MLTVHVSLVATHQYYFIKPILEKRTNNMKKLALITLATLALLGTQNTKATDLSKDEYITQLETRVKQLESEKFILPQDLSDDTVDYYAAYQIIKAYNGQDYDSRVNWTVNEHSVTIELGEGL